VIRSVQWFSQAVVAEDRDVFDADAESARDVDAGLDRKCHPGLEPLLVAAHQVRVLVPIEADAVTSAVDEALAVAGLIDHAAGCGVDRCRGGARARGRIAGLLRSPNDVMNAANLIVDVGADMDGARDVGAIPLARPAEVEHDRVAVIDAANRIVLPGFIDTHHHFYQGLLRSILTNGLLNPDYSRDIGNTLTPAYQPADAYAGVLVTALGMIDMGTTTAVDTSQVSHTPEHSDACIRALQESGIRAVYAYWRGSGPDMRYPEDLVRLQRSYFSSQDQLLTLALGAVLDAKIFSYAREVGVRCVSHGVSNNTERTLLELGRAGLLRPGDEYIHCTHLSDTAWRLLKDTGAHVSVAAPIEMAMGHGLPPIQAALDHGIRPSLSSDVDATMAQDPFTIMRSAFTLQRLMLLQRARGGEQNLPPLLTSRDVIELATLQAPGKELRLLHAMGWDTANIHLGTRRKSKQILGHLNKQRPKWLHEAADDMVTAVISDWKTWKKDGYI